MAALDLKMATIVSDIPIKAKFYIYKMDHQTFYFSQRTVEYLSHLN